MYRYPTGTVEVTSTIADITLYGHVVYDDRLNKIALDRHGKASKLVMLTIFMKNACKALVSGKSAKLAKKDCDKLENRLKEIINKHKTVKELHQQLNSLRSKYLDVLDDHNAASMGISMSEVLALIILCKGKGKCIKSNDQIKSETLYF